MIDGCAILKQPFVHTKYTLFWTSSSPTSALYSFKFICSDSWAHILVSTVKHVIIYVIILHSILDNKKTLNILHFNFFQFANIGFNYYHSIFVKKFMRLIAFEEVFMKFFKIIFPIFVITLRLKGRLSQTIFTFLLIFLIIWEV